MKTEPMNLENVKTTKNWENMITYAFKWISSVNFILVYQCVSEPCRGRVSAELSKPVERKGAMGVVLV